MSDDQTSSNRLWSSVKASFSRIGTYIVRYPLALLGTVLVVVVAVLFMFAGKGDAFNWGGLISRLFGRKKDQKSKVEIANEVPEDRTVPKEKEGEKGYKQKEVKTLNTSNNPLRDKKSVTVQDEDGKKKNIELPEGVEDKDVEKVYRSDPKTYKVKVKNKPEDKDLESLKDALK
jgi:hypothetical protein